MGTVQARKKRRAKNKEHNKSQKAKNYLRAHDQIVEDMQPDKRAKLENQPIDEDLPGMGQYYCVWCAKYFMNENAMKHHLSTKSCKRRYKEAMETPAYTQAEAELYGGLPSAKGLATLKRLQEQAELTKQNKAEAKARRAAVAANGKDTDVVLA